MDVIPVSDKNTDIHAFRPVVSYQNKQLNLPRKEIKTTDDRFVKVLLIPARRRINRNLTGVWDCVAFYNFIPFIHELSSLFIITRVTLEKCIKELLRIELNSQPVTWCDSRVDLLISLDRISPKIKGLLG